MNTVNVFFFCLFFFFAPLPLTPRPPLQLSGLDGTASVALVRRFAARRDCRQRMWRQAARVAAFVSQLVLAQALLRPDDQNVW